VKAAGFRSIILSLAKDGFFFLNLPLKKDSPSTGSGRTVGNND
jgi:hypothetical protein